jgi:hypothetical protein
MDEIEQIVRDTVAWYGSGGGLNNRTFTMNDPAAHAYAITIVDVNVKRFPAAVVVMAHVENDTVVIDADNTDRPLVDALVNAGVPREKIVLAHVGEQVPTTP